MRRKRKPRGELKKRPIPDRFWEKVDKSGSCWMWKAALNEHGYGVFGITKNNVPKTPKAHRVAWMLVRGPIPDGMDVLHHCDNPGCVNPDHLFLGTHQDNMTDMVKKKRQVGYRKITPEEVQWARSAWRFRKFTQIHIASILGVTKSCISAAINRRNWDTVA